MDDTADLPDPEHAAPEDAVVTPALEQPPPPTGQPLLPPPTPAEAAASHALPGRTFPWPAVAGLVALALVAVGAALLLVRSNQPPSAAPAPSASPSASVSASPTASPSATPSPSGSPSSTASAGTVNLAALVVHPRDVPEGYVVGPIPGGTDAEGEKTLDVCSGTFPSEQLRSARLQVAAVNRGSGDTALSTEAVRYESPDAAAQALSELAGVAASCAASPSPDPGIPGRSARIVDATPDAQWPRTAGVDRQAYVIETTDSQGRSGRTLAVYLRRGENVLGVYFPSPDSQPMPVEGATTIPEIVALFEGRLLNPPPVRPGDDGSDGSDTIDA